MCLSLIIGAANKDIKTKRKFCNYFHNILRFFDVLPNFPFPGSETMPNYYL